ncbi:centromere protein H isoform X1 [Chrysemys picta bellii]|uniref:centromere protein H isoform X1 n=1 Tax=Chrysemys picta bellii TaxID=8478 RepID=UPI0032B1FCA9
MEPLQRVKDASKALGKLAAHSAAAGGSVEAGAASGLGAAAGEKLDLVTLLRLREQIKQQLMEYNTTVHAGEESIPDQAIEEKLIEAATEDLEREMEQVKVSFQNKTLVLQRIQLIDALRTKLRHTDADSKLILETIKHIIMLSTAILESQQATRELEEKLNEIKKRRFALKQAGEHKLLQIHTLKKKQKEELLGMEVGEMLKRICRNLQKETQMTTLIQNIFQGIIIGSKVNWAEDPVLKAIVLQLEKNVNCI